MSPIFRTCVAACLIILCMTVLALGVMAQSPQPSLAPLNPAFVNHFQRQSFGLLTNATEEGYPLGLIPPPVDLSQVKPPRQLQGRELLSLPASFDLRTQGKLTAIRDQANCGSCWAFACYGSLESALLPGETRNVSENHLKNNAGFDVSCCDGGNSFMTSAYLARWSGPVYETDDPYNTSNCVSPPGLLPRKHVQNVDFIPDKTSAGDNGLLKQAVMTYGAVHTSMFWSNLYYNASQYAYYFDGFTYSNHAVCIVGWDDNFDRTKFPTIPPANGAFIVRNSWGTGWGQSGYFYASYCDSNFGKENAAFRGVESITNYAHIYQYDPLGWVDSMGYSSNSGWFANKFTTSEIEIISAVSFYVASPSSPYEIRIYLDPTTGPINPSGPAFTQTGTIASPGYQTVPISGPILTAGRTFSVVVHLTTPGYNYPIPIESPYAGYSSGATASAGQSYVSVSGTSWYDLTSSYPNDNCCLKAFTKSGLGMVTPTTDLVSSGPVGGPFDPASKVYTLTNPGVITIDWTASKTQPWVDLSSTGGSLGPGQSTTVTVSINSQAGSLVAGDYSDAVSFLNTTNGQGDTIRSVSLAVRNAYLDVTPAEDMLSYGEPTGAFSQPSKVYTLRNSGCAPLNWTAAKSQAWLDLSASGGTLAPGATTNVTVSLNSAAEGLPLGEYSDTVTFANTTNGEGGASRAVHLTVAHNYYVESATFSWISQSGQLMFLGQDDVTVYPMPFTFYHYGQPYTTVYIGENGLLGFNSMLTATENTALPTMAIPNNAIYPYWDDLDISGGSLRVCTLGQEPNRKVVITWQSVPHAGSTNPLTFQVLLCEGSNDIIFQYQEVQPGDQVYGAGRSATVGLENAQGTAAKVYSVNGSTLLTNNLAIRFTMDPGHISVLKKLPDNSTMLIHRAIVSCAWTSLFYIESDDRSCGIRVYKTNHGIAPGTRVDLKGTISTNSDGERYIKNPTITRNGKGTVDPFFITNRWLGGADLDYNPATGAGQGGIKNAAGMNNIGLLVKVTGRVKYVEDPYFYIDDGSKLDDGSGHLGVKVDGSGITLPALNSYVRLIGASCCWINGSDLLRQVRAIPQVIEQY